jgi:hypothetical protein
VRCSLIRQVEVRRCVVLAMVVVVVAVVVVVVVVVVVGLCGRRRCVMGRGAAHRLVVVVRHRAVRPEVLQREGAATPSAVARDDVSAHSTRRWSSPYVALIYGDGVVYEPSHTIILDLTRDARECRVCWVLCVISSPLRIAGLMTTLCWLPLHHDAGAM